MTHYRRLYSRPYLASFDLDGAKEVIVEVARVEKGKLSKVVKEGGKSRRVDETRPVLYFRGRELGPGLVLNATNGATMADLFGLNVEGWSGKKITLYVDNAVRSPTGGTTSGLRIRPRAATGQAVPPPVDETRPQPGIVDDEVKP